MMTEMEQLEKARRADYEIRRKSRVLGLSIDHVLTGFKNIIVFSDQRHWDNVTFGEIQKEAADLLLLAQGLEKKLSSVADIYASFTPDNPETTTVPEELQR
jgi:hypothetical protein